MFYMFVIKRFDENSRPLQYIILWTRVNEGRVKYVGAIGTAIHINYNENTDFIICDYSSASIKVRKHIKNWIALLLTSTHSSISFENYIKVFSQSPLLDKCQISQTAIHLYTLKPKGRQDDSPDIHWRRWRQASTSPVNIKAVTLTTFPFLCTTPLRYEDGKAGHQSAAPTTPSSNQ